MKTTQRMQNLITQIAKKHNLDLTRNNESLRLNLEPFMPLVIECIGPSQVAVAHYAQINGDQVTEPEVVFFTGYEGWVPISIQHSFGGVIRAAELSEDGENIARFAPKMQADIAEFCHLWASNIQAQGWLKDGVRD